MGAHAGKEKDTTDRRHEEKENHHSEQKELQRLEENMPQDLNEKIEFLSGVYFAKMLKMKGESIDFFEKVIKKSNIKGWKECERASSVMRVKINELKNSLAKNISNKGALGLLLVGEFISKIRDSEFKALISLLRKCDSQQQTQLLSVQQCVERVLIMEIKVIQVIRTIELCENINSIIQWWRPKKDLLHVQPPNSQNNNQSNTSQQREILSEIISEIEELEKQLKQVEEKYQEELGKFTPRNTFQMRISTEFYDMELENKKQMQIQQRQQEENEEKMRKEKELQEIEDRKQQELLLKQKQEREREQQLKQLQLEQEKQKQKEIGNISSSVHTYLPLLFQSAIKEVEFDEILLMGEEGTYRPYEVSYVLTSVINKKRTPHDGENKNN